MKKASLIGMVSIAFFLASCTGKTSTESATSNGNPSDTLQSATQAAAGKKETARAGYTFKTSFRQNEDEQCDALIISCQSGEKIQEFVCEFNWAKNQEYLEGDGCGDIEEVDLNFDGMPDLLVRLGDFGVNPEMFPTVFYAGFVWNEEAQCFEQVEMLDGIPNIEINAEKQVLVSEYANPAGDVFHEVYAWKDGKLEMVESTSHNEFEEEE